MKNHGVRKGLTRVCAIKIARAAGSKGVHIPKDAPVLCKESGKNLIVIFKMQLPLNVRGPDYYAQVTIEKSSGKVVKVLNCS